jgi:hypothetical protein
MACRRIFGVVRFDSIRNAIRCCCAIEIRRIFASKWPRWRQARSIRPARLAEAVLDRAQQPQRSWAKGEVMRNLAFNSATLAIFIVGGTLLLIRPTIAAGTSEGMRAAANSVGIVDEAQFVYEGRRHCFYPDGWHGPGWYWCGYNWRRGYGWGGPEGWHGWRRELREERREERREWRRRY